MRRKPQQPHAGGTLGPREASASLSKPVLYTSTTLAKNLGKKTRIKKRMAFYAVISDYFSAWKFADPIVVGDQIFLGVSSGPCSQRPSGLVPLVSSGPCSPSIEKNYYLLYFLVKRDCERAKFFPGWGCETPGDWRSPDPWNIWFPWNIPLL